jgi:hemoglobin
MPYADLKPATQLDDAQLADLVERFYARVRGDASLAGIFNAAIAPHDWPHHLERMGAFWSSVMLGSGRYHGSPVAAHLKHADGITQPMFARWLVLWEDVARQHLSAADADAVVAKARRIAESLQLALFFRLPPA